MRHMMSVRRNGGRRYDAGKRRLVLWSGALVAAANLAAAPLVAQVRPDPPPVSAIGDTVTVVPGSEYEAGPLHRKLLGDGWRDVWLTPVDVVVFGFDRFQGGVHWTERGGGNQSITLHLAADDGWPEYLFRSVNKFPEQSLSSELSGTTIGGVVSDLIAAYFPAAPLMVPPYMQAVDLLHVKPVLRIMPDDPRLEVYQDTLAGLLGTVELKANEAPEDRPGYAGSSKIKGTEEFFDDLEDSKEHRLDERQFLAARLVDFLLNDTDRTMDNMRWARYGEEGDYRWRPLPIDRDWAFVDAEGWLTAVAKVIYPKLTPFGPDLPSMTALTYSSHLLDRRLLQRLTRQDFVEVAELVQRAITDDVVEAGLAEMPERWRTETGAADRIRDAMPSRRDQLDEAAMEFYEYLAAVVDIRGTDEADVARVERLDDGRVRVIITWPEDSDRAGDVFYDRTFLPSETDEVRVYLHGGDDVARVVGAAEPAIRVRLIGGGGDDVLEDEADAGRTHLYDDDGDNEIAAGRWTDVSTKDWDAPVPTEGVRLGSAWSPDWGGGMGWSPAVGYGDVSGLVVGFGPSWKGYGFRRLPYHWQAGVRVLYALGDGGFGVEGDVDYRLENSPLALTLEARAVPFADFRFNGYGNDSPDVGDAGLVAQDRIAVAPALTWHIGWRDRETTGTLVRGQPEEEPTEVRPLEGRLDLGPVFLWTDPRPDDGAPLVTEAPLGADALARTGLRARVRLDRTDVDALPRRGWRLSAAAAGYPAADRLPDGFVEGSVRGAAFVPVTSAGPHLALQAGGSAVSGTTPVQHAPFIGGRTTVRGYRWQRYRGDAAAFGSAELRVPVMPVELLVRWELGVFGLADAGRVWMDGESPGGWHAGFGGGVWLRSLGQSASVSYAYGEEGRVYLNLGLSF
jgi:hypothetical protein